MTNKFYQKKKQDREIPAVELRIQQLEILKFQHGVIFSYRFLTTFGPQNHEKSSQNAPQNSENTHLDAASVFHTILATNSSHFHQIFNDFHFKFLNRKPLFSVQFSTRKRFRKSCFSIQLQKIIKFDKPQKALLFTYETAISQFPISTRIQNQAFENQHENAQKTQQKIIRKVLRNYVD